MSGRSMRTRTKSARALASEASQVEVRRTPPVRVKARAASVQKPKYILESNGERASTPPSSRSSSRAASPASSVTRSRRSRSGRSAAARLSTRPSGSTTPLSRASRSSSVTSNGRKPIPKLKLKTKLHPPPGGRGYNPSAVNYKDSEYHYGSDFEDEADALVETGESDKSSDDSDLESEAESDDLQVESDVDLEAIDVDSRPVTPLPVWLRDDEAVPALAIPPSSDDLPIPSGHLLPVLATYEILRQFHQVLRLTPFRVEDFCLALMSEEQSNLLSEIHMALLKTIIRAEDTASTFGALDQKDSVNSVFFFMDSLTWPESMRAFFQSDPVTYAEPLATLKDSEYPFSGGEDMIVQRIQILGFLADQILLTASARDFIQEDGKLSNEEHCRVCHRLGEMLVCDTCPGVYHLGCLDPPLADIPDEEWRCYVCEANDVEGVTGCNGTKMLNACRQEALGHDRMGNKYWFLCRRLVIELRAGGTRYYSTVKQLEEVSEVLDDEFYERDLWSNMEHIRIEMERQMEITEYITQAKKSHSKKSYFEVENSAIEKLQQEREQARERASIGSGIKPTTDDGAITLDQETEEGKKVLVGDQGEENASAPDLASTSSLTAPPSTPGEIPETSRSIVLQPKDSSDGDLRLTRRTLQDINSGTLYFKLGQEGSHKQYINQYSTNVNALSKSQANEERIKRQHISHKFSLTDASAFKWVGNLYGSRPMLVNTLRQTLLQLENNVPTIFMHPNWPLLRKPWIGAVTNSNKPRDFARALTVLQCCMKPCILLPVWNEMLGHTSLKKILNLQKEEKKRQEKREKQEREAEEERLKPFMAFVKYTLGLKHQVSKQKGEEYRAHGQYGWLWMSSSRSFVPQDARTVGLRAGPFRLAVKYSDIRDGSSKIVLMEPKAFCYLVAKQDEMDERKKKKDEGMDVDDADPKDGDGNVHDSASPALSAASEKQNQEKKRLEDALKHARLQKQDQPQDLFKEVVDVSAALTNPTRVLFPKVAKKAKVLDEFLNRRLQLRSLEERRIELKLKQVGGEKTDPVAAKPVDLPDVVDPKPISTANEKTKAEPDNEEVVVDVEGECDTKTSITSILADQEHKALSKEEDKVTKMNLYLSDSKKSIWSVISNLREAAKKLETTPRASTCYSSQCASQTAQDPSDSCYSVTCPNAIASVAEAREGLKLLAKVVTKGNESFGMDLPNPDAKFKSLADLVTALQNLVKLLMTKKEEFDKYNEMGMSTVSSTVATTTSVTLCSNTEQLVGNVGGKLQVVSTTSTISMTESKSTTTTSTCTLTEPMAKSTNVNDKDENLVTAHQTTLLKTSLSESKSTTETKDGITRVYSSQDTTTKLYLKRIQSVAESKKQSKVVKYPLAPHFYARTRRKRNILLLAKHDVKHIARNAGTTLAEGFNYNCKMNNQVWPYPCPRPMFRTAWLYRTACMESLQAVALQLRILWACLRWDDIQTRPVSMDGKHQQTTDSAVHTTEIVKHRHVGRFSEKTQYFQKKTTIPLDVPKTVVEVTPIRSGLRKRKRAESPQQSEPKTVEDWIEEEKLELWELRAYREKIERDKNASMTRSRTGVVLKEPQRFEPPLESGIKRRSDGTPTMSGQGDGSNKTLEERLKLQQGKTIGTHSPLPGSQGVPTIIRRVTNPDGTISLVRSVTASSPRTIAPTGIASATPVVRHPPGIQPGTKKVFISKDGRIIGAQVMPTTSGGGSNSASVLNNHIANSTALQSGASPGVVSSSPAASGAASPSQQKVQIVRSGDGKIQVKGLLPGQQLVQMPDGKLQIFSTSSASTPSTPSGTVIPNTTLTPQRTNLSQGTVLSPLVSKVPLPSNHTPISSAKPNQIVAQYLPPGTPIPPGMSVFISGGKTFCIPKATSSVAGQTPGAKTTPIVSQQGPIMTATPSPTIGLANSPKTTTPVAIAATTPGSNAPKQMVEVKSLGANTVTFKGNQMIVSGPDVAQAQHIAKQLSTGQAKLAMIGGKQVLISTTSSPSSATANATPGLNNVPIPSQAPNLALPSSVDQQSALQPVISGAAPTPPTAITTSVVKKEEIKDEELESKPQVQVTAQLLQTPQGPRIVLQGIQGSNLPPEDLAVIQQQVKTQLLKAQAEAKQQGKVPPTKIVLDLPTTIQAKLMPPIPPVSTIPPVPLSSSPEIKAEVKQEEPNPVLSNAAPQVPSVSNGSPNPAASQPLSPLPVPLKSPTVNAPQAVQSGSGALSQTLASLSPVAPPTSPKSQRLRKSYGAKSGEGKKRQQIVSKMGSMVLRQKELLKKDIALKRALQEKDLQVEIRGEIERLKEEKVEKPEMEDQEAQSPVCSPSHDRSCSPSVAAPNRRDSTAQWMEDPSSPSQVAGSKHKRKREDSVESASNCESTSLSPNPDCTIDPTIAAPARKRTRNSSSLTSAALAAGIVKKDKIYCICKTKYDASKFYVGCDICSNWFHGACVGITESMSRDMSEYICKECKAAKENQEIFCICKQPYDESQFYIGCERCGDWFHGRCVGILQKESESIDEYLCPKCDPTSHLNQANMGPISDVHYEHINKLLRQVMSNRNSGPFRDPVRPKNVPNYYKVVKEPMDLQTIETRVSEQHYQRLCEFVGDFMRIFENCRYFNQPSSSIMRCAESLESFFAQKLVLLRERLVQLASA